MQEDNNVGPSGTRQSSNPGSNTSVSACLVVHEVKIYLDSLKDQKGAEILGMDNSSDTIPARIRHFLCSLYEPLHTRCRAAFHTSHPTPTILPTVVADPTPPQAPSTRPTLAPGAP